MPDLDHRRHILHELRLPDAAGRNRCIGDFSPEDMEHLVYVANRIARDDGRWVAKAAALRQALDAVHAERVECVRALPAPALVRVREALADAWIPRGGGG